VKRLAIAVAGAEHEMLIGAGLLEDGAAVVRAIADGLAKRGRGDSMPSAVFMIVDAAVESTHAARLREALAKAGVSVQQATVEATETNKTIDTLRALAQRMIEARIDRHGLVLGVGGGIVGDLAGFVAATFSRGIACALVPTTLLAMVDAAIGGKTGVNLELADGALGKNLLGTFTQPVAILADPTTLATLPPRVLRCGFAECVKHGYVADADLLCAIEQDAEPLLHGEPEALTALVARSAAIKIDVVVGDERERGARAHLNLGHTFGHAMESETALGLMHGEAVAIGLVAAAHVAVGMGRLEPSELERLEALLMRLGLPTRLPESTGSSAFSVSVALERMGFDKKNLDGTLHLIVPERLGRVGVVVDPPRPLVRSAWRHVGATECPEDGASDRASGGATDETSDGGVLA